MSGPDVSAKSKLDLGKFSGMIDLVAAKFSNIKIAATTLREVHSSNHHSGGAVAGMDGDQTKVSKDIKIINP